MGFMLVYDQKTKKKNTIQGYKSLILEELLGIKLINVWSLLTEKKYY